MYAIVKTGGKQYKVSPGDKLNIEKINAEVGSTVELPVICVVDGEKVEADPDKAAKTKVMATILEQFKDDKKIVFKFKKRKTYRRMRGHRQQLSRVRIESVGSEKASEIVSPDELDDVSQIDETVESQNEEIVDTLDTEAIESQNNEVGETLDSDVPESQNDEITED